MSNSGQLEHKNLEPAQQSLEHRLIRHTYLAVKPQQTKYNSILSFDGVTRNPGYKQRPRRCLNNYPG